jgi:hypothetical protein
MIQLTDGSRLVRSQVLLQAFKEPHLLKTAGKTLHTSLAAPDPLPGTLASWTAGLESVHGQALEGAIRSYRTIDFALARGHSPYSIANRGRQREGLQYI